MDNSSKNNGAEPVAAVGSADSGSIDSGIIAPPQTFFQRLRFIGPSLILTGSIVGSGELIVTTTLGAKMGFVALWLIIISCAVKVIVQEEIGRYAISSGESALEAVNHIPGPRLFASWVIWGWMIMSFLVTVQVGGIVRGIGQSLNLIFPNGSVLFWGLSMSLLTVILLLRGRYRVIERTATLLVAGFTLTTVVSAVLIQQSPHAIRIEEILEGLTFSLPAQGLAVAFAVFGITGIGTTEIFYYPSWCLEKGYARFTGRNTPGEEWAERARGWVRVMRVDAVVAMIIYTSATVAFYLLGAAILHRMGKVPEGSEMIQTLSNVFTQTMGPGTLYLFLVGSFLVLYSTLFVSLASNALLAVSCAGVLGHQGIRNHDPKARKRWLRIFICVIAGLNVFFFVLFENPVSMVLVGGIAQTAMLPVIAFSVIYLRYRRLDRRLLPSRLVDTVLWLCGSLILVIALYTLGKKVWELYETSQAASIFSFWAA